MKKCVARVVDGVVDLLLRGKRYLRDLKFFTKSVCASGTTYVGPQVAVGPHQNLVVELLRNQQEMLRENQVLMQSMVNRMERELGRKKGPKKLAAKQAEEAAARPSTDPFGVSGYTPGSSSSAAPVPTYTGGNRAEKYLPSLPIVQRGKTG